MKSFFHMCYAGGVVSVSPTDSGMKELIREGEISSKAFSVLRIHLTTHRESTSLSKAPFY